MRFEDVSLGNDNKPNLEEAAGLIYNNVLNFVILSHSPL